MEEQYKGVITLYGWWVLKLYEKRALHALECAKWQANLAFCLGWMLLLCATLWQAFSHPVIEIEN